MQYINTYDSPLGQITLLSDDNFLLGLWFSNQAYFGAHYDLNLATKKVSRPIELANQWLDAYFAGHRPNPASVPLKPEVTPFRDSVLSVLKTISYGYTMTYLEISDALQADTAIKANKARAVGSAVGHNPISLIIPCHRVVGSDGSLTGYAGGIERKRQLLAMESK